MFFGDHDLFGRNDNDFAILPDGNRVAQFLVHDQGLTDGAPKNFLNPFRVRKKSIVFVSICIRPSRKTLTTTQADE